MAPSSDYKVEIVTSSGDADMSVTVVGDQVVDLTGASDGDVLTVQSDGTVAPETPAAADTTLVVIAETILSGTAASIDIANISTLIPAGFTPRHLRLVIQARITAATTEDLIGLRANNDSGSNYSHQRLYGQSSTPGTIDAAATYAGIGYFAGATAPSGYSGSYTVDIPHYLGTAFQKHFHSSGGYRSGTGGGGRTKEDIFGAWRNTAAIDRLTIVPASGSLEVGTIATLYAIAGKP